MPQNDRFNLEGWTYYQQGRKCGKPDCKCQNGELHGPYWYKRDRYGTINYIGKELPADVATARAWHDILLHDIDKKRHILLTMYDAMTRLIRNESLTATDRQIIEYMGFGNTLVPRPADQVTQECDTYVINNLVPPCGNL